jgi:hypothetical protein
MYTVQFSYAIQWHSNKLVTEPELFLAKKLDVAAIVFVKLVISLMI